MTGPIGVPTTSTTPNAGQAATQFGAVDFYLRVVDVRRAPDRIAVDLEFTNRSNQQQRADPRDFSLEASAGKSARPIFPQGCPDWGRVDLYGPHEPAGDPLRDPGGTRAPSQWRGTLCFPPSASTLTLIWEPDVAFGPLSEPIRIPLR